MISSLKKGSIGAMALLAFVTVMGCAPIVETVKVVAGTSTKELEAARMDAITKTYVCDIDECFDAVLSLATNEPQRKPITEKYFTVFLQNRIKCHIVVMGIPGNLDTTEVGVFLEPSGLNKVKVDVSSLSTSAKRKVSEVVFAELDRHFVK